MPRVELLKSTPIARTPRVAQIEGIFDLPPSERSEQRWSVNLDLPEEWSVGLIVGPSGAGKSTVARELFGDALVSGWDWPDGKAVVDGFPRGMGIKDITDLLCSVGFSSPPSWLRPYHVLSNGERFRADLARTLAEQPDFAVVDEFTSVVDRTVAKIGSAAVAKAVRRRGGRFVAVTCHYDVAEWLEPDWVYEPHIDRMARDRLQRPDIALEVARVDKAAWAMFRHHHYLDTSLNSAAVCFCAFWDGRPVAFSAWLAFPSSRRAWREHRTVCLPDFQGVGIGNAVSSYLASVIAGRGEIAFSTTSHPGMIRSRQASTLWAMHRSPSFTNTGGHRFNQEKKLSKTRAASRLTAGFRYVGTALPRPEAERVWTGGGELARAA